MSNGCSGPLSPSFKPVFYAITVFKNANSQSKGCQVATVRLSNAQRELLNGLCRNQVETCGAFVQISFKVGGDFGLERRKKTSFGFLMDHKCFKNLKNVRHIKQSSILPMH